MNYFAVAAAAAVMFVYVFLLLLLPAHLKLYTNSPSPPLPLPAHSLALIGRSQHFINCLKLAIKQSEQIVVALALLVGVVVVVVAGLVVDFAKQNPPAGVPPLSLLSLTPNFLAYSLV